MIYFAQRPTGGPVKVGFSSSAPGANLRVCEIARDRACELRLLAIAQGSMKDERAIHHNLRAQGLCAHSSEKFTTHTEWYWPTIEVAAVVANFGGTVVGVMSKPDILMGNTSLLRPSQRLRLWRKTLDLSQIDAAIELGISQPALSDYERGLTPTLAAASLISKKTGIAAEDWTQ